MKPVGFLQDKFCTPSFSFVTRNQLIEKGCSGREKDTLISPTLHWGLRSPNCQRRISSGGREEDIIFVWACGEGYVLSVESGGMTFRLRSRLVSGFDSKL
jgi:hypothetical protein